MLTQFANPHARRTDERVVLRRDIHADEDEEPETEKGGDEERLRALDALVRQALGMPDGAAEPARKRRRTDALVDRDVVPFRLLSTTAHPTPLHLGPKPHVAPKIADEFFEDDARAAAQRASRAASVAVDFAWVLEQSAVPLHTRSRNVRPATVLTPSTSFSSAVTLLELPLEKRPKSLFRNLRGHEKPSPHIGTPTPALCPIVAVAAPALPVRHSRRRRKKN